MHCPESAAHRTGFRQRAGLGPRTWKPRNTIVTTTVELDRVNATYAKVSRHIVPLMFLAYVVAYLDRVNVCFPNLQMLTDLRFSVTMYGFGDCVFFVSDFCFGVPGILRFAKWALHCWL